MLGEPIFVYLLGFLVGVGVGVAISAALFWRSLVGVARDVTAALTITADALIGADKVLSKLEETLSKLLMEEVVEEKHD